MEKFIRANILYIICFIISFIVLLSPVNIVNSAKAQARIISANNKNQYKPNPINLRPLTSEQIINFLKEKDISALSIKNIKNFTVILSESNNVISFYGLTSDRKGNIKYECSGTGNKQAINPVSIGSGGGSGVELGTYFFNWIIINDKDILNNAYSIKITYNDKTELTELVNNKKGFIIPTSKSNLKGASIVIYGNTGNTLYRKII